METRKQQGNNQCAYFHQICESRNLTQQKYPAIFEVKFLEIKSNKNYVNLLSGDQRRIDAFKMWCWRRLLRVPWTAQRSNQSILKEISPGCSMKGLLLKPELQYLGHLMQKANSLEKTLMLGKIEAEEEGGKG